MQDDIDDGDADGDHKGQVQVVCALILLQGQNIDNAEGAAQDAQGNQVDDELAGHHRLPGLPQIVPDDVLGLRGPSDHHLEFLLIVLDVEYLVIFAAVVLLLRVYQRIRHIQQAQQVPRVTGLECDVDRSRRLQLVLGLHLGDQFVGSFAVLAVDGPFHLQVFFVGLVSGLLCL